MSTSTCWAGARCASASDVARIGAARRWPESFEDPGQRKGQLSRDADLVSITDSLDEAIEIIQRATRS